MTWDTASFVIGFGIGLLIGWTIVVIVYSSRG